MSRVLNVLREAAYGEGHISVGRYGSKVGERLRPFLVTSVAVLVAMVKLVVRMVVFISEDRVRAKPYIGMT